MNKRDFLIREIWLMTLGAAFQRANIYNEDFKEDNSKNNKEKEKFRAKLRRFVEEIASEYKNEVAENKHIKNIESVCEHSRNIGSEILRNGYLNFGVSQKLLNLYLKYLWCLEEIPTPPHFPVDRMIQEKLQLKKIVSWTQMDGEQGKKDYWDIINFAKQKISFNDKNLASLELRLYSN